ncbi:LacI family DNA-binding transcriptional regulator [Lactobacillus sp. CC-MHH1034]|uniref:LacI family DNA-binding transcriptional regulator n=1 Tax=Agrilactobacillus fermenti TaxID=2586909 RepID=UPI001E4A1146|nr:LacI family DNA-binding transcriptional regulator [Agrilactobacillus fermenti]MCD2256899.1 LacI family DNA-binding transcriptional regulator [Agrilactobacillus fermenti]
MVTISDVAKLAGVSVSTVSRVINDNPHVTPQKRQAILNAMNELGYAPLQAARQLRGSGTETIAVVVPEIVNPFFSYLVDTIERVIDEKGFKTLIIQTFGQKRNELNALNLLKVNQVDGVILCAIENDFETIKAYLTYGKIAVCNEYVNDETVSMIYGNQFEGIRQGTQYLLSKGKRRIAYCTGRRGIMMQPRGVNFDSDRYLGFIKALQVQQLSFDPELLFTNAHTIDDGKRILQQIRTLSAPPDAVVAGSDEVATGIVSEAVKSGLQIPDQLAVLGVDDQPLARYLQYPLTTIRQPIKAMGHKVAEVLLNEIKHPETKTSREMLDLKIVPRKSA